MQFTIRILSILACMFLTLNTLGQSCEYIEYFRLTDLAKKDCKKENFQDARKNFKLAFEKKVFPLGHDLSYAFFTANTLEDNEWAGLIAKKLAKGGIPLRYFTKFKKKKWYKQFVLGFQSYTEYFKKNFNVEMRNCFLAISQDDNRFINEYHKWRERKIELTLEELISGAEKVVMDFKAFNKEYGFPNEQEMGYYYVRRKNSIEPYLIEVLMIHIYQMGAQIFKDDIEGLVCEGSLHLNYEKTLKNIRGFGDGTGVEQEMKVRYKKYRGTQ